MKENRMANMSRTQCAEQYVMRLLLIRVSHKNVRSARVAAQRSCLRALVRKKLSYVYSLRVEQEQNEQ